MAAGARAAGDAAGDLEAVVLESMGLVARRVAIEARDVGLGVLAVLLCLTIPGVCTRWHSMQRPVPRTSVALARSRSPLGPLRVEQGGSADQQERAGDPHGGDAVFHRAVL
jgi:hypothetical protein